MTRPSIARDLGLLVLRLGVGGTLFAHGAQKLFGWFGGGGQAGTAQMMSSMGFEPGQRSALLAGLCEAGGGALIAAGLATGPAGAAVTGNMAVAGSVHAPNGFFGHQGGYELPATFALFGSTLSLTGAGRLSLDHLTGDALNRPWMRVAALTSAVASAAYLITQRNQLVAERGSSPEEEAPDA